MASEIFYFKQFCIQQDRCAMKVGTDGVLLGATVCLNNNKPTLPSDDIDRLNCNAPIFRVLDIGTGTGILSLMTAQRLADEKRDFIIDAIEIDKEAASQAAENVANSPWKNNIRVFPLSFDDFLQRETNLDNLRNYDLIISNPPFYNATLKPEDLSRAIARHKDSLPLSQLMKGCQSLLAPWGRLALIYPMAYDDEVMSNAIIAKLNPIRIINIQTKIGKPCKRRIAEFSFVSAASDDGLGRIDVTTLPLRDEQGEYSVEYRTLTKDFYVALH